MLLAIQTSASAKELVYECSVPPLEATFSVAGGHYNGVVNSGNLFLQTDIPTAPVIAWKGAKAGKLYTLLMLDFDGNAAGSWPDPVAVGENSPIRHWIVGNISGTALRGKGYIENAEGSQSTPAKIRVIQPYRSPRIPVVSDRYGIYLFEQKREVDFKPLPPDAPVTNFDYKSFLDSYELGDPEASNFFVAVYISESPFSGKAFHGNDVSAFWHKDYGKGKLPLQKIPQ